MYLLMYLEFTCLCRWQCMKAWKQSGRWEGDEGRTVTMEIEYTIDESGRQERLGLRGRGPMAHDGVTHIAMYS